MILQFHVQLRDAAPPIWRRIQVRSGISLARFNTIVLRAMGWEISHLSEFKIGNDVYGYAEFDDFGEGVIDFKSKRLSLTLVNTNPEFVLQYDFGDDWIHDIRFECCANIEKGVSYPRCIDGAMACPPEDVGGIYGYEEFLKASSDLTHEDHELVTTWLPDFDPNRFDSKEATNRLRKRCLRVL